MSVPFKLSSIRRAKARMIITLCVIRVNYPEIGIKFRCVVRDEAASMALVRLRIARAAIKKEPRHE